MLPSIFLLFEDDWIVGRKLQENIAGKVSKSTFLCPS